MPSPQVPLASPDLPLRNGNEMPDIGIASNPSALDCELGGQSRSGPEILDKIAAMRPGTLFFNSDYDYHLVKVASDASLQIDDWHVLNVRPGTLHHISEFWLWGDSELLPCWTVVEPDDDD